VRHRPGKISLSPDTKVQEAENHSAISRWKHIETACLMM